MEKQDTVKVFLRIRPEISREVENSLIESDKCTDKMIVVSETSAPFVFDHIFYDSTSQQEVFKIMVEPSLNKLLNGYNCSLLAYGQSGAGKTFTMGLNETVPGMIGMSIDLLFKELDDKGAQLNAEFEYKVQVSFVEIYNDKVFDLLTDNNQESIYSKGSLYNGATKVPISNSSDANEVLQQAKNRHVRETNLNRSSSRSHALFSVFVTQPIPDEDQISSVIHFCDLGGSEGLRNTQHKGIAQQEGVNINQGLLSIKKVIDALSTNKHLIPYRDSVLTVVLKDSLNINSFLTILGCISSARKDRTETMSTIRFAQSVKTLDNKSVPEFNAYVNEKKRLQARTPLKKYMQPFARNEQGKTPGQSFSTKTPNKMLPPSNGKYTGASRKTPSASRNFSFQTPAVKSTVRKPLRQTEMPRYADTTIMHQTADSVDNNTFSVLNISTSTECDGPTTTQQAYQTMQHNVTLPSFSPLMRQINQTIDSKLASFMESLKNQTIMPDSTLRETIRKSVLADVSTHFDDTTFEQDSIDLHVEDVPTSSTVLRRPRDPLPTKVIENRTNRRLNVYDDSLNEPLSQTYRFTTTLPDTTFDAPNVTVITLPLPRRSTRISTYTEIVKKKHEHLKPPVQKTKKRDPSRISGTPPQIKKSDHVATVLATLNKGSQKSLQKLPTIGLKTAYQITTYRSINGRFKTIEDLKKVPAMKGKIWEKFVEANMLQ